MKQNKRGIGTGYEHLAAAFLRQNGYVIVHMNFRSRFGEIDIVARDGNVLVFLEVKYRNRPDFGMPWEAVDLRKQIRICRTADFYRARYQVPEGTPIRFDVVAVLNGEFFLFRNAFFYHSQV